MEKDLDRRDLSLLQDDLRVGLQMTKISGCKDITSAFVMPNH